MNNHIIRATFPGNSNKFLPPFKANNDTLNRFLSSLFLSLCLALCIETVCG